MEALRVPAPARAAPRFARLARSLPDDRLVARVRAGDQAAFEALFDRYHRQLLSFCRHMVGTREEAEDALQHVFVSAYGHLSSEDDRVVELRPWLYAIARNRCLSVLRARREAVALDDVPEPTGNGLAVADEVERRQDLQDVLGDMARLPDDQRAALVLSELGALSHDEVAEVLGVRREKVKALVFQSRESLAAWRQARDADCREIREQLANLRGGALRRGPLRKHLDTCDGCRAFRSEVRRQREAMALLLPVVPSVALKAKVLGAVAGGGPLAPVVSTGAAGAGIAGTVGTGAAATGGGAAALGGMAGKALVVAAIAGTAGGGYAIVRDRDAARPAEPATRVVEAPRGAPLSVSPTAAPTPAAATPAPAVGSHHVTRAKTHAAKGERGRSAAARTRATGRPAVPGATGLSRAPKSQGLAHRRSDPPAYGRGGVRGQPVQRGSERGRERGQGRPASPPGRSTARPAHPVEQKPARPVVEADTAVTGG